METYYVISINLGVTLLSLSTKNSIRSWKRLPPNVLKISLKNVLKNRIKDF